MRSIHTLLWPIALCLGCLGVQAQPSEDYSPLRCAGPVPEVFLKSASEKAREAIAETLASPEEEAGKGKAAAEAFLVKSRFFTHELLQGGLVLFGDPVSTYIQEVAARLLRDEPDLARQMQFFTLRVPWVNAMATDEGVVFVTMGLMAHLENEAQLAYILAHEIAHYKKRHGFNVYKKVKGIQEERQMRGFSKKAQLAGMDLIQSLYHIQSETEADSLGMLLFARSGYALEAALRSLDVLEESLQPWRQMTFEPKVFEDPTFRFPSWYVAKSKQHTLEIPQQEVDILAVFEELARPKIITHPEMDKRRAALRRMKARLGDRAGDALWQVSEPRFREAQLMARFELPRYFLREEAFYDAIYHALLLLETQPENAYLKRTIAQALYTLAKYRNAGLEYVYPFAQESPINGLANFFEHMERQDYMLFVVRHLWKLKRKMPQDELIGLMAKDALLELALYYDEFSPEQTAALAELPKLLQQWRELEGPPGTVPRYASLYKESQAKKQVRELYPKIALAAVKDEAFDEAWTAAAERAAELRVKAKYLSSARGRRELAAQWEKKRRKGVRLGMDKVLVMAPQYYYIRMRWVDGIPVFERDYLASEEKRAWMRAQLDQFAEALGLEMVMLDPSNITSERVDLFNDLVALNEWRRQQINFLDLTVTPAYNHDEVMAIVDKYGVSDLLTMDFVRIDELKLWLLGAVLFDLNTGIPLDLSNYMSIKLKDPIERQILYDLVYQLTLEAED